MTRSGGWVRKWRGWGAGLLGASALAGCAAPVPPHREASGMLPSGPDATYQLSAESAGGLVPADAVAACLGQAGLQAATPAHYLVQVATAVRPAASAALVGAATPPKAAGRKPRGERLHVTIVVDRLADGSRVASVHYDETEVAKRATPASRAQAVCAALKN